MKNKNIAIYGSTGSIGTQTLDVVSELQNIKIVSLVCNSNITLLLKQIEKFKPKFVGVVDQNCATELDNILKTKSFDTKVFSGVEGSIEACNAEEVDTVVSAAVGIAGLRPTVEFIKNGKNIAIANKETLVTGGDIVINLAKKHNVSIIPVDSEHSAIFQSIQGNKENEIEKILLTCSGGPFRGKTREELKDVTVEQALNHPNWSMGNKITIDSATLMNKGLEIMEAKWLFNIPQEKIEVIVHPQSIIHSAVQYSDGSIIAQLGTPNMRLPIQYALTYPRRERSKFPRLDLFKKNLEFEKPDEKTFKSLRIARDSLKMGGTYPTVVNGANEQAVSLFLNKKIKFLDIMDLVETTFVNYKSSETPTLKSIFAADKWSREFVDEISNN